MARTPLAGAATRDSLNPCRDEPIYEKTIALPLGYVFTARARPSSISRTAIRLLPWALVAMAPAGRTSKIAQSVATRIFAAREHRCSEITATAA